MLDIVEKDLFDMYIANAVVKREKGTSDPPSRGVPVFSQEKRNGSAVGSPTETSIIQAVEDEKIQKQQRKKNITHTPA